MNWFGIAKELIIPSSGKNLIESGADIIDRFVDTKGEKAEREVAAVAAKREFDLLIREFEVRANEATLKDRQDARSMYKEGDNLLQKIYAMFFLAAYFAIISFMIYTLFGPAFSASVIEIPAWGISLISSIFGGMSTKVNTITDFLFGGSQGERDNTSRIQNDFKTSSANQAKKTP